MSNLHVALENLKHTIRALIIRKHLIYIETQISEEGNISRAFTNTDSIKKKQSNQLKSVNRKQVSIWEWFVHFLCRTYLMDRRLPHHTASVQPALHVWSPCSSLRGCQMMTLPFLNLNQSPGKQHSSYRLAPPPSCRRWCSRCCWVFLPTVTYNE